MKEIIRNQKEKTDKYQYKELCLFYFNIDNGTTCYYSFKILQRYSNGLSWIERYIIIFSISLTILCKNSQDS